MSAALVPPTATAGTYLDATVPCCACGLDMTPGTWHLAWTIESGEVVHRHAHDCPRRWTPVLLDGGGERTAPTLPLLAVVRDAEAER